MNKPSLFPLYLGVLFLGIVSTRDATAGAADYVYTPTAEFGEKEIDFKYGTAKYPDGSRSNVTSLGFGYGATESWFTEIYLKRESDSSTGLNIAEWENKFQLTETGQYAVDVGLLTELEAPLNDSSEPYELKLGALFQTEFDKLQLNGNLLFERKFGRHVPSDPPYITEMGYQWQVKYRWKPALEFGAQGIGEWGEWNHWENHDNQVHRIGPAVFGKHSLGNRHNIKYNAAWLLGTNNSAPDNTFRMQVEYEF